MLASRRDYRPILVIGMGIGSRIKQARLANGISQARLADLLGITRSACSQWESCDGGTIPRSSRLAEIADLLGVSFAWLLTGNTASGRGDGAGKVPSREPVSESDQPIRPLTKEQKELVGLYEHLSPQARSALLLLLRSAVSAR